MNESCSLGAAMKKDCDARRGGDVRDGSRVVSEVGRKGKRARGQK